MENIEDPAGRYARGEDDTNAGLDVNHLLAQYGRAMARVGQLESRIQTLEQQVDLQRAQEDELAQDRISLQNKEKELTQKEMAIATLQKRITVLNAELGDASTQHRQSRVGNSGRRHRKHPRAWWQFWHRPRRR